jgi:hypothetical protein
MDHDMHDDGLVHGHAWATEPPPSIGELLRPALDQARARPDGKAGGKESPAQRNRPPR